MKSNLPDFSLNLHLLFRPGREENRSLAFCRAGLLNLSSGFSSEKVLNSFGLFLYRICWCLFPSLSPGEAQVLITVGDSLMLGYKGHECLLSPLQLGVRQTYTGVSKKSLQQKKLLVCFS